MCNFESILVAKVFQAQVFHMNIDYFDKLPNLNIFMIFRSSALSKRLRPSNFEKKGLLPPIFVCQLTDEKELRRKIKFDVCWATIAERSVNKNEKIWARLTSKIGKIIEKSSLVAVSNKELLKFKRFHLLKCL